MPLDSTIVKAPLLDESFENNRNNWITENSWLSGIIEDGAYYVSCKNYQNQTGLTYKAFRIREDGDYEIETSFKVRRGSGALVFGISESLDHYRVEISGRKNIYILKNSPQNNKIDVLYSGVIKPAINEETDNKITIRKIAGSYYFLLNDRQICQLNNITARGDDIGFSVPLRSEIEIDYLKVNELKPRSELTALQKSNQQASSGPVSGIEIAWISPTGMTTYLDSYSARIRASVRSSSALNGVLIYVNGVSMGGPDIKNHPDERGVFLIEKNLNFGSGENSVYIVANNMESSTKSEVRYFNNPSASIPVIFWRYPLSEKSTTGSSQASVEVCIKTATPLKTIKVLVNGIALQEDNILSPSNSGECDYLWKKPVVLREGDNNVIVAATNAAGTTLSEERLVRFTPSLEEKRIALVIGNSEYANRSPLNNPVNDANLMEATLKELGFEVIKQLNSTKDSMINAVRSFTRKLSRYNIALFYYAGHGLMVDGKNYLIPSDARLNEKIDCKFEAMEVDFITDEFKKHSSNTNIVILDACRNNPFRSWVRGEEAGFKALAPITGTIISFATSEGATAADGNNANGLFTEELVKQMVISQPIESVFKNTRRNVIERSNGQQTPTEWSYLTGEFYFTK